MPFLSRDISPPAAGGLLFLFALLPFASVLLQSDSVVSIEYSEFPVKMWCYLRFWEQDRFFGGRITEAGFPDASYLNNPDIVATLFLGLFKPIFGALFSFNLLLFSVMLLNLSSLYFLARQFVSSRIASLAGAVAFAWNSLLLSYGFASNITDLIHVWPYAFSIAWLLIGLRQNSNRAGWAAGLFLGFGFLTCPYNFVLFLPSLTLLLPWLVTKFGLSKWRIFLRSIIGSGLLCGVYAWKLYSIMNADDSLVQGTAVADSRHQYPFSELLPYDDSRFTLYLAELLWPTPVIVEQVARFIRSFYLGWIALGVALFGLFRAREPSRWLWVGILVVFVLIAAGPYASITKNIHLSTPSNPLYLLSYHLFYGKIILEPFRYFLVAGLGFGMLVAIGFQSIPSLLVQRLLLLVLSFDLMFNSTVGWPLPTIQPTSSSTFQTLEQLQPGGIVHLPFFRQGHNLFDRDHFTYQLAHEYPIGDPIMGFPPKAYLENALLCTILHLEYSQFPISLFPCTGMHSAQSVLDLQRAGFTAIVVDTDRYSDPYRRQIIDLLNRYLDPTTSSDSILIYSLHR